MATETIELVLITPPLQADEPSFTTWVNVIDHVKRPSSDAMADSEGAAAALPPVDGGVQAWTFVFCAFIVETLVWGFPFSYGVFQEWYLTSPASPFRDASEAAINAIGTVTIGIQYMEGLAIMFFMQRYPQWARPLMVCSLAVCVGSLVLSSFATKVWHLIALQGVVYGIAGGALYMPLVAWLSEWFVTRRAFAGSFIFGGSGLGGAGFPILANALLHRVGFRWTLRVIALLVGVLGSFAMLGAKPRLPTAKSTTPAPLSFQFLSSPVFITVVRVVYVLHDQALGYFPVSLYIPSYAASLGYSNLNGTLALAAFNLATVVGQILFGYYCDIGPYTTAMIGSSIVAAVFAFVLWGFAHSLVLLYVFSILFGGISGGFSSVFPPAAADVFGAQSASPFLFFACAKGLAAISGPFVAASLHPDRVGVKQQPSASGWAGYGFTAMEIFVGTMMAATAVLSLVVSTLRGRVNNAAR